MTSSDWTTIAGFPTGPEFLRIRVKHGHNPKGGVKGHTMGLVGYGKIKDGEGLREAFQQILLTTPPYDCGILRITGETSGLITVRSGKFITGGAVTGSEVVGIPALKELFSLTRGLYSYLSAEELPDDVTIDQSLMVDIDDFLKSSNGPLASGIVKYCWKQAPTIEDEGGWAIERPVSKNKRTSLTGEHNFLVAQDPRAVELSQESSGRQASQSPQAQHLPDPQATSGSFAAQHFPDPQATSGSFAAQHFPDPQATSSSFAAQHFPDPQATSGSFAAQHLPDPQATSGSFAAQHFADPQATSGSFAAQHFPDPQATSGSFAAQHFADPQATSGSFVAQHFPDPQATSGSFAAQHLPDPQATSGSFAAQPDPFGIEAFPDPLALPKAPDVFGAHQPNPFAMHESPDPLGVKQIPDPGTLQDTHDPFAMHEQEITLPLHYFADELQSPNASQSADASAERAIQLTQDPFTLQQGEGAPPLIFPQAQDLQNFRKSQELHNFRQAQEKHQAQKGQTGLTNSGEKLPQWQSQRMLVQPPPEPHAAASGPAPPSLLNTMIHNTKRTYMRLAALGGGRPGLTPPGTAPLAGEVGGVGRAAQSVRSTALKMASRVMQERTKRTGEILQKNQVLRTTEIKTNEVLELKKSKSIRSRFDRDTILGACVILVAGGMAFMYIKSTNPLESVAPLVEQGKKDLSRHKIESAIIQFTLALGKKPNDPEVLALRARAYEDSGDLQNALADYQQILKVAPNDGKILTKAALAEYKSEHFDAAISDCDKALKIKSRDGNAQAIRAMALARSGSAKEAIRAARPQGRAINVPSNLVPLFHGDLGYAYMTLKQPDQAIHEYTEGLNDEFKNWRMFLERGQCYMQKDKMKEATADFKEAINLKSADPQAYNLLGDAYAASESYALALKAYGDAVKLTPKPSNLYLKIAHCYFNMEKYGDTERACDFVLRLAPADKQAKDLRNLAMRKAKSAKPLLIGDRTVFYAPDQPAPSGPGLPTRVAGGATDQLVAAGYNALTAGNYDRATTLLSQAVSKDGNNFFARRFLGQALLKRGDAQHAYEQFDVVGQKGLLTSADQMEFGKAAQMVGRANKAAEIYENCIKSDPTWLEARLALIKTLVALGNAPKAAAVAEEGSALRPQDAATFQSALGPPPKKK